MSDHILKAKLTGVSALIIHNGQLADPLNEFNKALREIASKKKKTEADYEAMAKIEFYGGLYLGEDNEPEIPGHVLEATIINGAKKNKLGKEFLASVYVSKPSKLSYKGYKNHKTREQLFLDKYFRLTTGVKVKNARIMRTRPIFNDWSIEIEVHYDDSQTNLEDVKKAITLGGSQVGIGEWRPKYGRYEVTFV